MRQVARNYDSVNIGDVGGESVISGRVLAISVGVFVFLVSQRVLIFFSGLFVAKKSANNNLCRGRLAGESDLAGEVHIVCSTAFAGKPAPTDSES
ncbi:hypothetical protein [Pseudomonas sp. A-B-19]|uniref:hypothetical protein n=1 Tax=Pseudomonas sp. A-B-19 TaxID=2832405 RepID=UPI001CBADFB9|nr:hypothetical protein [Pseudomonas sp. A-B-19]